jgi:hypothetical protein
MDNGTKYINIHQTSLLLVATAKRPRHGTSVFHLCLKISKPSFNSRSVQKRSSGLLVHVNAASDRVPLIENLAPITARFPCYRTVGSLKLRYLRTVLQEFLPVAPQVFGPTAEIEAPEAPSPKCVEMLYASTNEQHASWRLLSNG